MKSESFKKLPGVLSFRRGFVISDALIYNYYSDDVEKSLQVVRSGIRGTQNINSGSDNPGGEITNIQITEVAKLDASASAFVVRFHIAFLPLETTIHDCHGKDKENATGIRQSIESFIQKAKESEGLNEVARRYARNIANGRWLWRNRIIAKNLLINIYSKKTDKKPFVSFNSLNISTNNFDNYTAEEIKLADEFASQMRGESTESFTVEAIVTPLAPGIEVFPSQNYIPNKPKGFARSLYKIGYVKPSDTESDVIQDRDMGQAAIRDQKIFNAIRTIDTWYPEFEEEKFPISVEPLGANLAMQKFYREDKRSSAFELFKRLNTIDPNSSDGMFCIASLNRGGVYSEKESSDKKSKEE